MGAKVVRNLSVKTIGVNPKKAAASDDVNFRMLLATMLGAVTNVKDDEGPDGSPFSVMCGQFEATNADGEVFRSGRCFLPVGFDEPIIASIKKAMKETPDNVPVIKFGVRLYAIKATNPQGYSYEMEPLVEDKQDAAHDLLADIRAQVLALPAPTTLGNAQAQSVATLESGSAQAESKDKTEKNRGKQAA